MVKGFHLDKSNDSVNNNLPIQGGNMDYLLQIRVSEKAKAALLKISRECHLTLTTIFRIGLKYVDIVAEEVNRNGHHLAITGDDGNVLLELVFPKPDLPEGADESERFKLSTTSSTRHDLQEVIDVMIRDLDPDRNK